MKVSFAELKRHVIEVLKREEEFDSFEEEYHVAEEELERKIEQLRADFHSRPERRKMEQLYNRCDLWYKKRNKVREALENKYPGLKISFYKHSPDTVAVSYLGKVEAVAWDEVEDWMVITLLQSDNGHE